MHGDSSELWQMVESLDRRLRNLYPHPPLRGQSDDTGVSLSVDLTPGPLPLGLEIVVQITAVSGTYYAWQEVEWLIGGAIEGFWQVKLGGRTGTISASPAWEINGATNLVLNKVYTLITGPYDSTLGWTWIVRGAASLGNLLFTQTANQSVGNLVGSHPGPGPAAASIVGTGVGSMTLPANALQVGQTYRLKVFGGVFVTTQDPGTATWTLSVQGSTTATQYTDTVSFGPVNWWLDLTLTCRAIGSGTTTLALGGELVAYDGTAANATPPALATFFSSLTLTGLDSTAAIPIDLLFAFGAGGVVPHLGFCSTSTLTLEQLVPASTSSGGGAGVNPGTAGQIAYYASDGSVLSGESLSALGLAGWVKVTKTHTDFTSAGSSSTLTVYTLAAGAILEKLVIESTIAVPAVASTGSNFVSYQYAAIVDAATVVMGLDGMTLAAFDQAVDGDPGMGLISPTATKAVTVTATSSGNTLDHATAGQVTIWLRVSTLP